MSMSFSTRLLIRTAAVAALLAGGWASAQTTPPDADVALAARFAELGLNQIGDKQTDPACMTACAAALQAACKLDPTSDRYQRLLVEAQTDAGDVDGAIAALKNYRQLAPGDQGAQIELIGLNLSKMETVDAKVNYADQIMGVTSVSAEVRSAVAVMGAKLLDERGQTDRAQTMLNQAVRLNPLNIEALRMKYAASSGESSDFERTQALIGLVQANPLQTRVVIELAENLANFGLVKASLDWFYDGMKLYTKNGQPVDLGFATDYAAEQYIAERYDGADGLSIRMLQADPNNVNALYVRLLCAWANAAVSDQQSVQNIARRTLLARLAQACDVSPGAATRPTSQPAAAPAASAAAQIASPVDPTTGLPTTMPSEAPVDFTVASLPDLDGAINKLDPAKSTPEKIRLANAIADAAWYSAYFDPQPDVVATLIKELARLLPAEDVTLVRLQGWALLAQGKPDEAKVKLNAIADRDPLAALGLIKTTPVADLEANNRARKLLSDNPAHLLGAFLKAALRERGIKVVASNQAQYLSDQLDKFPSRWMDVIDKPSDFYLVRGEPLQGEYAYNEPMLVRVTLQNLSDYDLTMGPNGVIHNDLWVDAEIKLPGDQMYPGVAYERLDDSLVLRARQTVSRVMRVDRGKLGQALLDNPTAPAQIRLTVVTNPIATRGGIGSGPGGYRVQFNKLVTRAGFAIGSDKEVNDLLDAISADGPGRLNKLDLIAAYATQGRAAGADARTASQAPTFAQKLTAMRVDASPSVRSWAMYLSVPLADPDKRGALVQEMSRNDDWQTRFCAAAAANQLNDDARKGVLDELSNDKDGWVKGYASALKACPMQSPTSQPAAAPSTMP